jgi:hypothetical protein
VAITERDLREMHKRLKLVHGGLWQDCFAVAYLMNEFKLPEDEASEFVAFGGNDYGIDAFYISQERRNLYLYQFKFAADHKLFATSLQRIATAGIERIFGDPKQDGTQNALMDNLKAILHDKQAIVDRVLIHCVFLGDVQKAEDSKHLESLREDVESRKHFIESYFRRSVELSFEFISDKKRGGLKPVAKHYEFGLDLGNDVHRVSTPEGHELFVGTIPLAELYGFYVAMRQKLFARNIRFGLGNDTAPNRAIRKSLESIVFKGHDAPEAFTFFHNGVTLSAEALRNDGRRTIVEPRVLNGAQTITSVAKFLEDNSKNPLLKMNEERFSRVRVIARVIVSPPQDQNFITRVTINNNRQNPVEPWNLRANDAIQLQFEDAFREELGLFYERQEGAFEAMSDSELEEAGMLPGRAIEMSRFAKTLLALQGEVKRMSHLRDVFENEAAYEKTFKQSYLDSDLKKLVLAYKIQRALNVMTNAIYEKGESKYGYIFAGRNLIWALAIQGMLNDRQIDSISTDYGRDLKIPTGFRNDLRDLASTRLRFIIGYVAEKDHKDELAIGKTAFLNSDSVYEACMSYAKKEYGWSRRSV